MDVNKFLLSNSKSTKTILDNVYYRHINCIIETFNEEDEIRWETYNLITEHLISQGQRNVLKEFKYRITDNENPNSVMLDIIERYAENMGGLTWLLKRRLEDFLEEDYFKKFF